MNAQQVATMWPDSAPAISTEPEARPLLPRYQRPLGFVAVLDEAFRIFRAAWRPLMLAMTLAAVPNGILMIVFERWTNSSMLALAGAESSTDPSEALDLFGPAGGSLLLVGLLSWLILLPSATAVVVLADGEMRGARPPVMAAYARGLRAVPAVFLFGILLAVAATVLFLLAVPLLVLGAFGILGGLVALIGVLVWWRSPRARKPWLCWLVLLAAPFGLPIYFLYRWALALPGIVFERAGPLQALRRSTQLTRGHWFYVSGTTLMVTLIAGVLQVIPGWIAAVAITLTGVMAADTATVAAAAHTVNMAMQHLGMVVFGSVPAVAVTLVYNDLRNRGEGADLLERLGGLERAAAPAAGRLAAPWAGGTAGAGTTGETVR